MRKLLSLLTAIFFVGSMWGTAPTLDDLNFDTPLIDENFNGLATVSKTATVAVTVKQTEYGAFNYIYNNNTGNTYAIANAVATTKFSTNCLSLSAGSTSPLIAHINGPTWGDKGAFRFKTTKTSTEYVGFYAEKTGTIYGAANSSVYVRNQSGTISLAKGSGSGASAWNTVGSYTTNDIIDICVIYNNTTSATTYGNNISIGAKRAHFYIDGTAVMDGNAPKEFEIPGATLHSFRVAPLAANGNKAYVDDVQIWDELPTSGTSDPSLTASPTTIDFGKVELGASVASKKVVVNFANLTGPVTYSELSSPFNASGSITTTDNEITIAADASSVGDYSQTMTIQSAADSKSVEVTVKMKVETPADAVLDFTSNSAWKFPTSKTLAEGSYTSGLYTIKVAGGAEGTGYYFDSNHLFIGKQDAYITLPTFSDPIEKIECLGVSSGSGSVSFNVYQDENAVSEAVTSCRVDQTFEIAEEDQAADVAHTIKITNDNNARFAGIKIWLKPVTRVGLNPKSLAWGDQKQNVAPEAKTFKLKGSHLTAGLTLAASSGYSVSPTSITADEAMADSVLVTVTPATPTATGSKNGTITISGGGLTADSVLALSMNVIETFAVNVAVVVKDKNNETIPTPEGIRATLEGVTTYYVDAENGEENLALEATTIAGYNFTGWTKNSDYIVIADVSEASTLADVAEAGTITANFKEKQCTVLATPTNVEVSGLDYPYDGASITWDAVANAASYEVYIKQGVVDVELDEVETNSYNLTTTLAANTTYTYEIIAVPSNKVDYCSSNAASDEFTTTDLPAATLTLSENGVTRTWGENLKITDEIALPTEVVTGVVNKVLVGWSADADCASAPEYAKGAMYTITTASPELYAVYATRTSSPTFEQLTSDSFDEDAIYVIGAEQSSTNHTMWYFNGYENVDKNSDWGLMTSAPATNEPIQLKLSGSANELVVREVYGDQNYVGTSGKFLMLSTSTTIALANDGTIKNEDGGSKQLRHNYNGGNGGLRWYDGTTGTSAYFYEYDPHISYSGYTTTGEVPTSLEDVETSVKAVKLLRNGILLIEKNGHTYNAQGLLIK